MSKKSGFYICDSKGFHIGFANGWTVSVQFGPGNYCDNYDQRIGKDEEKCGKQGSGTAECAILNPDRSLVSIPEWGGDTVSNRSTPEDVLRYLQIAAKQSPEDREVKA